MSVRVLAGALKGARWVVGSCTHGCWLGTYEADKQKLFAQYVRPGMIVYDVGANVGFYTLLASRLAGASGHVYAFEPMPRNVSYLERHIRLNDCRNVTVRQAAVGERDGEALFREEASHSQSALDEKGSLRVRVVALDSQAEVRPPDVIKMDIEGGEAAALKGAVETLRRHRPVIFLATHGHELHRECSSLLSSIGYSLTEVGDSGDELLARCESRQHASADQ